MNTTTATQPEASPGRGSLPFGGLAMAIVLPSLLGRLLGAWGVVLVPLITGSVFLISLAVRRPIIGAFVQQRLAGRPEVAARLKPALTKATALWGVALIGEAALLAALGTTMSASSLAQVTPFVTWGLHGLMVLATIAYLRSRGHTGASVSA